MNQYASHLPQTFRKLILFVLVAISSIYFFTGGGWNQASRFDLVRAVTELGTLQIDKFVSNTGDRAKVGDHYYSDKAPGLALLAIPVVFAAEPIIQQFANDKPTSLLYKARVATIFCVSLPHALTSLLILLIGLRLGFSESGSSMAALTYGIGTPAWAYSTLFWGHSLAGSFLTISFFAALHLDKEERKLRAALWPLVIGGACAAAVVTEFPAAGGAAVVGLLALGLGRRLGGRKALRDALLIGIGALGPVLVLATYNALAFGSPFRLGYSSVQGFEGMDEGLLGVTFPKPQVVMELLFGTAKGLLPLSPVLILCPLGWHWMAVRTRNRLPGIAAASIVLYYLAFNASYHYWNGGDCLGPRHLGAAMPFMALGLIPVWDRWWWKSQAIVSILAGISVAIAALAVSTHAMTPGNFEWPLRDLLLPAFVAGRLSLNQDAFFDNGRTPSFNLGEAMGLEGHLSLVPLALVWSLLIVVWVLLKYTHSRPPLRPSLAEHRAG